MSNGLKEKIAGVATSAAIALAPVAVVGAAAFGVTALTSTTAEAADRRNNKNPGQQGKGSSCCDRSKPDERGSIRSAANGGNGGSNDTAINWTRFTCVVDPSDSEAVDKFDPVYVQLSGGNGADRKMVAIVKTYDDLSRKFALLSDQSGETVNLAEACEKAFRDRYEDDDAVYNALGFERRPLGVFIPQ